MSEKTFGTETQRRLDSYRSQIDFYVEQTERYAVELDRLRRTCGDLFKQPIPLPEYYIWSTWDESHITLCYSCQPGLLALVCAELDAPTPLEVRIEESYRAVSFQRYGVTLTIKVGMDKPCHTAVVRQTITYCGDTPPGNVELIELIE